jgi:predicted small secreted protein
LLLELNIPILKGESDFPCTGDLPMRHVSLVLPMLLLATLVLSACNTMRGVGEDVQAGGEALEGTASRAQKP